MYVVDFNFIDLSLSTATGQFAEFNEYLQIDLMKKGKEEEEIKLDEIINLKIYLPSGQIKRHLKICYFFWN